MDKSAILARLEALDTNLSAHESRIIDALSDVQNAKRQVLDLIEELQD